MYGTKVAFSFEPKGGHRRLTEQKEDIMEPIILITISCLSLFELISLYWLWRP
jgi:hypothetical protein